MSTDHLALPALSLPLLRNIECLAGGRGLLAPFVHIINLMRCTVRFARLAE
jgi:hypothetical protein